MQFTKGFDEYDKNRRIGEDTKFCYHFTPKHQYSLKNNPLCGICLPQWIHLVSTRWRDIEWGIYWTRILFLTIMAFINTLLAIPEYWLYDKAIRSTRLNDAPVFVVGHPRTGTTLLHSLLALDTERFAICNTFCAGFPSCFLWFEPIGKVLFRNIMDDHRPMDMVKLDFDLPQEDELATTVLTGGISGYMPLYFMRQEASFRSFYTFDEQDASLSPLSPSDIAQARSKWIQAFLYLCRKLTLRAGSTKSLLLKSPVHTARIRLLLSLFPNAKFIYIHRNPYDVFRSACHMADTTYWYTYLNTPSDAQIQELILRQYEILWDSYERDRQLLRLDQLVEVSFNQLTADPVETVRSIYERFGWSFVSSMQDRLELASVTSFQRNTHAKLPSALATIVADRWGASFERLGHSKTSHCD